VTKEDAKKNLLWDAKQNLVELTPNALKVMIGFWIQTSSPALKTRPNNYAADHKTCLLAMTHIATIILNAMMDIWSSLRLKMFALDHLFKELVVTKFNIGVSE
jgi:hypothetical protein